MDREILRKWLEAGYVEDGQRYPTYKGTPQGGIISPILANMTLDGMEHAVLQAVPRRSRVNFIRYADDCAPRGFTVDEGRPLRAALQGEALNHLTLLR
jgi:retron-type reverse transcriptase